MPNIQDRKRWMAENRVSPQYVADMTYAPRKSIGALSGSANGRPEFMAGPSPASRFRRYSDHERRGLCHRE